MVKLRKLRMYHRKCNAIFHRSIHRANNPDDKCEVDRPFTQTVRIVGNGHSKVWLEVVKSTAFKIHVNVVRVETVLPL